MVRGLAIRQGLLALNLGLALAFASLVFLIGRGLLRADFQSGSVSEPDLASVRAPMLGGEGRPREAYDEIQKRGLFGEAGRFKRGEKPVTAAVPPPPSETVLETTLPLELSGTVISYGRRELSSAIIEVREGGTKTATFYPGQDVIENVVLREVRRQEVILENKRNNRTESLKVLWKSDPARSLPQSGPQARAQAAVQNAGSRLTVTTLDRATFTKKLEDEYAQVASSLNVKVVNDESGRPKGITTDNIEGYAVAKDLGLKNGDVLVSLNNEPIDSRERAVEVLQKYKNASMFRVGLLRSGQMQYLTFRVK